jgi:3-oxoadipate enol-lactonase
MDACMAPVILSPDGLAYRVLGSAEKPALVLTHGAFLDQDNLSGLAEALTRSFRLVLWDLPGHGRSSAPLTASLDATARQLAGLMDHLAIRKYWLLGHSYGGMVSQALIRLRSRDVLGFIAYACIGLHLSKIPMKRLVIAIDRWLAAAKGAERLAKEFAEACSLDPIVTTRIRERIARQMPLLRAPIWESMIRATHWQPDYRFPCPVGHIRGELDTHFAGAADSMGRFAATADKSRSVLLKGAGHCAHLEDPASFARELTTLLGPMGAAFPPASSS